MTFEAWLIFMAIWTAATIPLGPNALNCMATAASNGFRTSLWSVVGVFIAACIFLSLAVSGVAAFLAAHPAAFEIIRWCGVAYLGWMGATIIRRANRNDFPPPQISRPTQGALVRRAALISLSNPKAIFGWLAIFSQFIQADAPLAPQLQILAPSALIVLLIVYIAYCALGLGAGRILTGGRRRWFDRGTGSLYLIFAAGLAAADLRRS